MDWKPGTTLRGRYDVEARLGDHTWRVRDNRTGASLVCRVYRSTARADVERLQQALEQRRVLSLPGLPRVVDIAAEVHGGRTTFLMFREWIEGLSLRQMVIEGGSSNHQVVAQIGQRVLDVLWGLHGQSPPLIHGDLEPDHVLMDENGALYLIGLAAPKAAAGAGWRGVIHVDFGAPEALMGEPKPRSDYYALGGVLVFLVLGETPALGVSPGDSLRESGVPGAFAEVCERLLDPLVERRYGDLDQVSEALARWTEREQEVDGEEVYDEASAFLVQNPPTLADHLERLLPFLPEQFRLVALGGVAFFVCLIGVLTLAMFLGPKSPEPVVERSVAEGAGAEGAGAEGAVDEAPVAEVPAVRLDQPLSCPGGMDFSKEGASIRCTDKHGEMVVAPGVIEGRSAFLVDRLEVTVARYDACVEVAGCSPRPASCVTDAALPATCLTLEQAAAVCSVQRRRLCSDDEFEWVTRFHDDRTHPWGEEPADCTRAWTRECGDGPAPADRRAGGNAQGVEDLTGNVAEFLADGQLADGTERLTTEAVEPAWVGVRCCRDLVE